MHLQKNVWKSNNKDITVIYVLIFILLTSIMVMFLPVLLLHN